MTGGVAGVAGGLLVGAALIVWSVPVIFSLTAIAGAFGCAVLTGLVFGFMPARKAAALDPVAALSSE
ncbi:Macrolide export ATP-binding/permease protein MacB [compost metagenome]